MARCPYLGRVHPLSIVWVSTATAHTAATEDLANFEGCAVCARLVSNRHGAELFLENSFYGREWLVALNMFFIHDLFPALRPLDRSFDPPRY